KNWIVVDGSNASGHHEGRLYVVWDRPPDGVLLSYSDDKGQTWNTGSLVSSDLGVGAIPMVLPNGDLAVVFLAFGAGGGEDGRFRRDEANDAVVTWSNDEGITWRKPKRVNPGPRGNWLDRYNTAIAVGDDGSLRVVYLSRQEAPSMKDASPYVDVFYQQSLDKGRTFSAPLRLDRDRRADVRFAAFSRDGAFFGDYQQIAVAGPRSYVTTCRS